MSFLLEKDLIRTTRHHSTDKKKNGDRTHHKHQRRFYLCYTTHDKKHYIFRHEEVCVLVKSRLHSQSHPDHQRYGAVTVPCQCDRAPARRQRRQFFRIKVSIGNAVLRLLELPQCCPCFRAHDSIRTSEMIPKRLRRF